MTARTIDAQGEYNESSALALAPRGLVIPVIDVAQALARLKEFQSFIAKYLVEGEDYGTIPGTQKPTLYQPGADKLCEIYNLTDTYRVLRNENWDIEPLRFDYEVTCTLTIRGTDIVVAEGLGSCNSYEARYRWRQAQRTCPFCHEAAIIRGKAEYGGGWLCFKAKGGCGHKFAIDDVDILEQATGRIPNDDIASLKNTLLKVAKKRSKVDAVRSATRSSGEFTQDVEDLTDAVDDVTKPAAKSTEGKSTQTRQRYSTDRQQQQQEAPKAAQAATQPSEARANQPQNASEPSQTRSQAANEAKQPIVVGGKLTFSKEDKFGLWVLLGEQRILIPRDDEGNVSNHGMHIDCEYIVRASADEQGPSTKRYRVFVGRVEDETTITQEDVDAATAPDF